MTNHPREFYKAYNAREERLDRWRMIHHACEWKEGGACVKAWEQRGAIVDCAPTVCPVVREVGK